MYPILDSRIKVLIEKIPELIKNFKYRSGPDLYFYLKTMELRRKKHLNELFEDASDRFLELMYATLVSWDMNSRGAKMEYFDNFKSAILNNKKSFLQLAPYSLELVSDAKFIDIKGILGTLYENLHVMKTDGRLVSNSKVMHYILPDLVMPMDRANTLQFFFRNTGESKKRFMTIFENSRKIAKNIDLGQFLDTQWHQSKPKVIDNAILCHESSKYNKKSTKID